VTIATLRLIWTIRISTRSSMVWWRTRRTGRTRHFAGASPAECIPPTGGAAAINRNRPANGSEIEAAEAGRGHGRSISRTPILKSRRNALRCSALRSLDVDRPGFLSSPRTHASASLPRRTNTSVTAKPIANNIRVAGSGTDWVAALMETASRKMPPFGPPTVSSNAKSQTFLSR
jgi:hypothetical protein